MKPLPATVMMGSEATAAAARWAGRAITGSKLAMSAAATITARRMELGGIL